MVYQANGAATFRGGAPSLAASDDNGSNQVVVTPFDMRQASRGATMTNNRSEDAASGGAPGTGIGKPGDPAPTLADSHTPAVAIQDGRAMEKRQNGMGISQDGSAYTLDQTGAQAVAYQCHGSNVGPMGTVRRGNGSLTGGVPFTAFAQNQRDEVRDLNGVAGALAAEPGMKQQTYIAHALTSQGHDASEDGTGRGTPLVAPFAFCNTAGDTALGLSKPGVPPLTTRNGDPGNVCHGMMVRRLTPRECVRLQGFPEYQKFAIIRVCSDPQKTSVLAETRCPKWRESALRVLAQSGETKSPLSASFVATDSVPSSPSTGRRAALAVRLSSADERMAVVLTSGLSLSVSSAALENLFPRPALGGVFARFAVLMSGILDRTTTTGKETPPRDSESFTALAPGCAAVVLSAGEIRERASDAAGCADEASALLQSTTSAATSSFQSFASLLETLCCCVVTATGSCIPELMSPESSCDITLTVDTDWLDLDPTLSDSAKYRLLGNAVAVPHAEYIGRRTPAALD